MQETIEQIGLSKEEAELITQFNNNPRMVEAVKKVILVGMYTNGVVKENVKSKPMVNWALHPAFNPTLDNQQLGEKIRAVAEGINIVEAAFNKIDNFVQAKKPDAPKVNKAR